MFTVDSKFCARSAWTSTFGANIVVMLCGMATGIISARALHPEGRGALAALILWPQLLADAGVLGIHEALTQRIGACDRENRQKVLGTALVICLALSVIGVIAGFVAVPLLLGQDRANLFRLARWYIAIDVPANLLLLALYAFDHGQMRFWRYNLSRSVVPVFYGLGVAALFVTGAASVESILAANVASTLAGLCMTAYLARASLSLQFSRAEAAVLASLAWQFNITALLLLISSQADRIVVVKFWDNASVGLYVAALTVSTTGARALAHSFHTVIFPGMVRQPDLAAQSQYLARGLRHTFFLTCLSTAALMISCRYLVPLLFGKSFVEAVGVAIILLLAQIPNTLRQVAVRALRGIGEGTPGSIAEAFTGATFLVSAPLLAAPFGLSGLAWAVCFANFASLIYIGVYLRKRLGLYTREWLGLDRRTAYELYGYGRSLFART